MKMHYINFLLLFFINYQSLNIPEIASNIINKKEEVISVSFQIKQNFKSNFILEYYDKFFNKKNWINPIINKTLIPDRRWFLIQKNLYIMLAKWVNPDRSKVAILEILQYYNSPYQQIKLSIYPYFLYNLFNGIDQYYSKNNIINTNLLRKIIDFYDLKFYLCNRSDAEYLLNNKIYLNKVLRLENKINLNNYKIKIKKIKIENKYDYLIIKFKGFTNIFKNNKDKMICIIEDKNILECSNIFYDEKEKNFYIPFRKIEYLDIFISKGLLEN